MQLPHKGPVCDKAVGHLTYLVVSMGEIETGNIHASIDHPDEHVLLPTGRAQSANDLSLAMGQIDLLEDILELDAVSVGVGFYHDSFLMDVFVEK